MIPTQVEDIIRSMFQKGMLKDVPQSWSEDQVVDYMTRLNDPILRKGKIPTIEDEELSKAPEWARVLSLRLDQLSDLVPVFRRMNQERTRKAEQTAQRTRLFSLDTDEEKDLFAKEEKAPLKEQFHDFTRDNMEGATPGPESYPKPEAYPYDEQKAKRDSTDLAMNSGTRRRGEMRRAEERGPVQSGSEDLKRRVFGRLMEAQKREKESLEMEREIKNLPTHIEDLVRKLADTPFNKWSTPDMVEIEKFLTPEQATQLSDIAQERTEKRVKKLFLQ